VLGIVTDFLEPMGPIVPPPGEDLNRFVGQVDLNAIADRLPEKFRPAKGFANSLDRSLAYWSADPSVRDQFKPTPLKAAHDSAPSS
jgi:hypothetical protein